MVQRPNILYQETGKNDAIDSCNFSPCGMTVLTIISIIMISEDLQIEQITGFYWNFSQDNTHFLLLGLLNYG